jgi:AsmA family protein
MKILLRVLAAVSLAVVVLLVALCLYLAFGDLGAHKGRVEQFVTQRIGREFAIDGPFSLKLIPAIQLQAEKVRVGNAPWGSTPQMLQVGHIAATIDLWSLVSGPVNVRTLELRDVTVTLERDRNGSNNWTFGNPNAPKPPPEKSDVGLKKLPIAFEHATLSNLHLTYRVPDQEDRIARVESLTVLPASDGLLAVEGKGSVDADAATLAGELGPLHALLFGRDIRVSIQASLGNLQVTAKGAMGQLYPLAGADLELTVDNPDLGKLLQELRAPQFADGPMHIAATLKAAGQQTRVELQGKAGDITTSITGTIAELGLRDANLDFNLEALDAARLAAAFDVKNVPAAKLEVAGHMAASSTELKFEGVTVRLGGTQARIDGTLPVNRDQPMTVRFVVSSESLAELQATLPPLPLEVSGDVTRAPDRIELTNLVAHVGKTDLTGKAMFQSGARRHIEADVSTPLLDLTPLLSKPEPAKQDAQPAPHSAKKQYLFPTTPLPVVQLGGLDARLQFSAGEVRADTMLLKSVDATINVDNDTLLAEARASGGYGGSLEGSVGFAPSGDNAATLKVELKLQDFRAGLLAGGEAVRDEEVPPLSVVADITVTGASPRQLASSARGNLLLSAGPGKARRGALDVVGSGVIGQLFSKLNPFAKEDPYTVVDCTVARIDILNGKAKIAPVLLQTGKVTVTADGTVDLLTEALAFNFNTRPRSGIGVSPGMFTNPFLELTGTLTSPKVSAGAKGVTSGALAVATAGATVVAGGIVDRVKGEADMCRPTLEAAQHPASSGK